MTKKEGHRLILLAFLIGSCMILSPLCSAAEYTTTGVPVNGLTDFKTVDLKQIRQGSYDATTDGQRIMRMSFQVPADSHIDFTLYYGNEQEVDGYIENYRYEGLSKVYTNETVSIGGETKSYDFLDITPGEVDLTGYAYNTSNQDQTGFLVFSYEYGVLDNDLAAFYEVPQVSANLIYKVEVTGDRPFDLQITTATPEVVGQAVSESPTDAAWKWINFAISLGSLVLGIVMGIFLWLKFLFVDNLLMTVTLYMTLSMAYSAATSKNIFKFFGKFFNDQKKLFEFIFSLWNGLISLISNFRGIFRI